jgi:hypothetical protein
MQFSTRNVTRRLNGLGFIEYISAAASLLGSGSNSGSGTPSPSMPNTSVTNTVNPNINVSPQISPVFQQQFQPSNSAATAGTSQVTPSANNGFVPAPTGLNTPLNMPQVPAIPPTPIDWNKYMLWGGIAVAGLFALKLVTNNKRHVSRRRRVTKTKVK